SGLLRERLINMANFSYCTRVVALPNTAAQLALTTVSVRSGAQLPPHWVRVSIRAFNSVRSSVVVGCEARFWPTIRFSSGVMIRSRPMVSKALAALAEKLKPGKTLARRLVSETSALQYWIASWVTAIWWADRKLSIFATVGNWWRSVLKVRATPLWVVATPVIWAMEALISSKVRKPMRWAGSGSS